MISAIFVMTPGHCEAIKLLLSRGLPVDTVDQQDGTPLHAALGKDKAEAVKVLLEHGADVSMFIPSSVS
jgi:ankyrin repeat protein